MMAAGRAGELGCSVIMLEKMERPGKKIRISGNGRCNLSNSRDRDSFMAQFGPGGRFLEPAFQRFFRDELLALLLRYGVKCQTKASGKIYPASNSSHDIVQALELYMAEGKVEVRPGVSAENVMMEDGRVCGVSTSAGNLEADAVILATGGASHPQTGSTGDGFRMAAALGHTIAPLRPAIVPLVIKNIGQAAELQGAGLRGARVTAFQCAAERIDTSLIPRGNAGRGLDDKSPQPPVIESRAGDAVITPFGLSGPVILEISPAAVKALANGPVSVSIDLIPNKTTDMLRAHLRQAAGKYHSDSFQDILRGILPQKLIKSLTAMTGVTRYEVNDGSVTEASERFLDTLKSLRFDIERAHSMATAVVTGGGVSLAEIDPHSMGSRIVRGLYFGGEVMDLDAGTGGYNLQAAFSTGYIAGESAADFVSTSD